MSTIGPGSIGSLNFAGSIAGTQRSVSDSNEVKADAARTASQLGLQALESRGLDDVAESEMTPDRDADGRQPFMPAEHTTPEESQANDEQPERHRNVDPDGELGGCLDLEV